MIRSTPKFLAQLVVWAAIIAFIGFFAAAPDWRYLPEETAQVRLAMTHAGARIEPCRERSAEELAAMPRHARTPKVCPRGRVPVVVEIALDGDLLFSEAFLPTGFHSDGPSRVNGAFLVPAGAHELVVRVRDTARDEGFDYERQLALSLAPGDRLVVDFAEEDGGIIIR